VESWCVVVRRAVPPAAEQVIRLVGPFEDQVEARRWIRTEGFNYLQYHLEVHQLEEPGGDWRATG
jgi:hypothetical protein